MIYAGIDAGSRALKIVLLDSRQDEVVASGLRDQGVDQDRRAADLFAQLLEQADLRREDVGRIVATGYGRNIVTLADTTVTEITCHAAGVRREVAAAGTIIDIGGQDSKVIRLNGNGAVRDFDMNDRCAAGTGRFLEVVADRLDTRLDDLGELARRSTDAVAISSMCVVFAETEIVGLLACGKEPADIVAGVQRSIASRVAVMLGRRIEMPIIFTGGVALVPGMDEALSSAVNYPVLICPRSQMTGALGAALIAAQQG